VLDAIARRDSDGATQAMSAVILQGAKGAGIYRGGAPKVAVTIELFR
jgi:hypothetical protein